MAYTVNNVLAANFAPISTSSYWNQVWKLTRVLKKAGWKYLGSSNGTSKDTTADPALDYWGAGVTTNAGSTSSNAIASPTRGRATITGLSGIVAADKGRFLVISGSGTSANNHRHQIEEILSATSVRIDARTFAVAADAGTITWSIVDSMSDTYDAGTLPGAACWWAARGPSTIKIPITVAPAVGGSTNVTFVKGENIVQASSGWEGEIIGWVFDGVSVGYLVCAPRLRGTGGGIYGLTTGQVITGAISGSTVTQNGTALEYRHEIVIWKGATFTTGSIFDGVFEPVADSAQMFSTLTGNANCTGTVAPGGGGGTNLFPGFGQVCHGTTSSGGHVTWTGASGTTTFAQIIAADTIEEQYYSADGSWTHAVSSAGAGGTYGGFSFMRLDDTEDGDLDPYVFRTAYSAGSIYTATAASAGSASGGSDAFDANAWFNSFFRGWRKRGQTGEAWQDFEPALLYGKASTATVLATNFTDSDKVATALVATRVREPIWVVSTQNLKKMRKGTLRWQFAVGGGNGGDTYDNKKWIQLSPMATTKNPTIVGPWDGSTQPTPQ